MSIPLGRHPQHPSLQHTLRKAAPFKLRTPCPINQVNLTDHTSQSLTIRRQGDTATKGVHSPGLASPYPSSGVGASVGKILMTLHLIVPALTPPEGQNPISRVPGSLAPRPNLTKPVSLPTRDAPPDLSTTKGKLCVAWHGIELVLQKAEKLLEGTPFKTPVAALNVLVDIKNVHCHSWHVKIMSDPSPRLLQTIVARSKTVLTRLFGV